MMRTGVQFTGSLNGSQTKRWFTHSWPVAWHVIWYMMPTSPRVGAPQIEWEVGVERANATQCTYWITVKNLTSSTLTFEARYAVLS
jgi:hypothetical protein